MKKLLIFLLPIFLLTASQNHISLYNPEDAVSFTQLRNSPDWQENYHGLSNPRQADHYLSTQDYIPFLSLLWSEPDLNTRITYLEEKLEDLHTLVFFELALNYMQKHPTLENYYARAYPLLKAGLGRAYLDSACTSDKSCEAAVGFLGMNYSLAIRKLLDEAYSNELTEEIFLQYSETYFDINLTIRYLEPFLDPKAEHLPSPAWIFAHGMDAFIQGNSNQIPPTRWGRIRARKAQELIQMLQDIPSTQK